VKQIGILDVHPILQRRRKSVFGTKSEIFGAKSAFFNVDKPRNLAKSVTVEPVTPGQK